MYTTDERRAQVRDHIREARGACGHIQANTPADSDAHRVAQAAGHLLTVATNTGNPMACLKGAAAALEAAPEDFPNHVRDALSRAIYGTWRAQYHANLAY